MTYRRAFTPFFPLYYWSKYDENLSTDVKSENNWSNVYLLFLVLFIENELFTENGKKLHVPPAIFSPHFLFLHTHCSSNIIHTCSLHIRASL